MTNRPKSRGTVCESAVVKWLHANGYPDARRQPLTGAKDQGDLWVTLGVIAEVKTRNGSAGLGQPGETELANWMAETEAERVNAGAFLAVLIVKRKGTADPGQFWAYVQAADFISGGEDDPVCMTLRTWTKLMKAGAF